MVSGSHIDIHAGQPARQCAGHGLVIDEEAREVELEGRRLHLTRTEFDLLALLHAHPRHVLTPKQLLDHLWSSDFGPDDHPIEVYVHRLRSKLGESGKQPRFIHTVRGVGYRFDPQSPASQQVTLTYTAAGVLVGIDPPRANLWGWQAQQVLGHRFVLINQGTLDDFQNILDVVGAFDALAPRIHLDTCVVQRDGSSLQVEALLGFDTQTQTITAVVTWQDHTILPSNSSTSTAANRMRQSLMP